MAQEEEGNNTVSRRILVVHLVTQATELGPGEKKEQKLGVVILGITVANLLVPSSSDLKSCPSALSR